MPADANLERESRTARQLPDLLSPGPILRAVVSTVVPETSALDERAWSDLASLIEEALRQRPESLRRRLRLFLYFVQWLPLLRYGRRFTSLGPAERARFLGFLEDNPIGLVRLGFWGLRTLALLGYYGRPQAAEAIGYRAHPRGWEAFK